MPSSELVHIAVRADWERAQAAGRYERSTRGRSLADEGFVHCSYRHQAAHIANRFYGDLPDVVLLTVDADLLGAPVVDEEAVPGGERFPHVYGPIPLVAVASAAVWTRDPDGTYVLPE